MIENTLEEYGLKYQKHKVSLDVTLIEEEGRYTIFAPDSISEMFGCATYASGATPEEAEKEFWNSIRVMCKYYQIRANQLDKYKWFQKGDWSHIGGTWFTVLGIHVYFRYGEKMRGGFYIPFTKLNISIHNAWLRKKK